MHHVSGLHLLHSGVHRGPHPREARFLQVLASTLTLLSSVLASVHTCNHRACKNMYSAFGNPHTKPKRCPKAHFILPPPVHTHTLTHTHTDTHARSFAHTGSLVGAVLGGNPRRNPESAQCTRTHTQPHTTHTHTLSQALPKGTREGQKCLHVFSRWRGPETYNFLHPRVLRLRRSCEFCYLPWPWLAQPLRQGRRQKAPIWAGSRTHGLHAHTHIKNASLHKAYP